MSVTLWTNRKADLEGKRAAAGVPLRARIPAALACAALVAVGCASSGDRNSTGPNDSDAARTAVTGPVAAAAPSSAERPPASEAASEIAAEAARQPLRDVGLMKRSIPPALARIADPYAPPTGPGCGWLAYEINQIDLAIGPEPGAPTTVDDRTSMQKGREMAGGAVADAARGALTGLMPARGILRKLSGADKADRAYREAADRARVRRGYLRGLAAAEKCTIPAASDAPVNRPG
jgi:hypothetical protein